MNILIPATLLVLVLVGLKLVSGGSLWQAFAILTLSGSAIVLLYIVFSYINDTYE